MAVETTNRAKAKMLAGEPVYGCSFLSTDPAVVEMLGAHGWDYLLFDAEHGPLEVSVCESLVRAAEIVGLTPIVRPAANEAHLIRRYLDAGALGVQVPWIESGEAAEATVVAARHLPRGQRGIGGARAQRYGAVSPAEFVERQNADVLVIAQIESPAGVDAAKAIAEVPDLDIVFLGSGDLSQAMGIPGQFEHPDLLEALERAATAILEAGKILGVVARTPAEARAWRSRGALYFITTFQGVYAPAARGWLEAAREG
jgi:4-hydroxy-2-oxoheptanedioate aldolase